MKRKPPRFSLTGKEDPAYLEQTSDQGIGSEGTLPRLLDLTLMTVLLTELIYLVHHRSAERESERTRLSADEEAFEVAFEPFRNRAAAKITAAMVSPTDPNSGEDTESPLGDAGGLGTGLGGGAELGEEDRLSPRLTKRLQSVESSRGRV